MAVMPPAYGSGIAVGARTLNSLATPEVNIGNDDVGTGFSYLVSLQRLPLHRLKTNHGFVSDLASNASDRSIVKAAT